MSGDRVGVGVIGTGVISSYYLENLVRFPDLDVLAIADLDPGRAQARADEFGLRALTVDELLATESIEIVLNLTTPAAHFDVSMRILGSGKHVWSEKPLALSRHDGQVLLAEAGRHGLRIACAPDTILGAPLQTAQRTVLAGRIGEPASALAIMQSPGPEGFHPSPAFYYDVGGGPLLDTGPYYVTALVQSLGSVSRVNATSSTALPRRTVLAGENRGIGFDVRVPTQHMALLEFTGGARAALITSFDSGVRRDLLEIHGTRATLDVPNPTRFIGNARLHPLHGTPEDVPSTGVTWGRGLGVLDLARAVRANVPERASGALAYHVLDVLLGIRDSALTGDPATVGSTVAASRRLDDGWDPVAATLAPRFATGECV